MGVQHGSICTPNPEADSGPGLAVGSQGGYQVGKAAARLPGLRLIQLWVAATAGGRQGKLEAGNLHDGAHSSAVALPHAAETGLSPDVPELSTKRARWSQPQAGSRVPPTQPPLPCSLPGVPSPCPWTHTSGALPLHTWVHATPHAHIRSHTNAHTHAHTTPTCTRIGPRATHRCTYHTHTFTHRHMHARTHATHIPCAGVRGVTAAAARAGAHLDGHVALGDLPHVEAHGGDHVLVELP